MALTLKGIENWTLDDLLEAINPPPPSADEQLRRALVAIIKSWQGGELTDEQATTLIKAIAAANMNRQVNQMVNDFFTPRWGRAETFRAGAFR